MPPNPAAFAPAPTHASTRQALAVVLPKAAASKNNSEKSGIFLAPDITPCSDHLSPASHHDYTIKKPRSTATFSQNPLQKHRYTSQKKTCHAAVPHQYPRIDTTPHLNNYGVTDPSTGEENELSQPDFGHHHRRRHRSRVPHVSGPSSQLDPSRRRRNPADLLSQPATTKADSKESAFIPCR